MKAGGISATTCGAAAVPSCRALAMSAAPNNRPMSDGLIGDASIRTMIWSGPGACTGISTSDRSSVPSAVTSERNCRPLVGSASVIGNPQGWFSPFMAAKEARVQQDKRASFAAGGIDKADVARKLVRPAGFEPAASGLEVPRSIQLSYGRMTDRRDAAVRMPACLFQQRRGDKPWRARCFPDFGFFWRPPASRTENSGRQRSRKFVPALQNARSGCRPHCPIHQLR